MNEKYNFEVLVKLLSEFWYKGDSSLDDELDKFEEAISKSGYGESAFGVARANYDRNRSNPRFKSKILCRILRWLSSTIHCMYLEQTY